MEPQSTDSGISTNLVGGLVKLCPYLRGYFARDIIAQVWYAMEREDALKLVFYEKYAPDTTPVSTHADLPFVMEYFCDPKKILILVAGENDELAGLIWFDGIIPNFKLYASYWFRRKYWGHASREACKIGIDYVFNDLKIPAIWSVTQWLTSVKTTNTLGFAVDSIYYRRMPDSCCPVYFLAQKKTEELDTIHAFFC